MYNPTNVITLFRINMTDDFMVSIHDSIFAMTVGLTVASTGGKPFTPSPSISISFPESGTAANSSEESP